MSFIKNFKYRFINAFREVFLYHYSSLEFRAKLFAAVITANKDVTECEYEAVRQAGMFIYNDEARTDSLVFATKEYVEKVFRENGLDNDMLISDILRDLKDMPRYAKKIDTTYLTSIIGCHHDMDTAIYQNRIIELFENLREEYENRH
jgi:polysaccharide deacetylase 2 family uncharacterized protein YibQ